MVDILLGSLAKIADLLRYIREQEHAEQKRYLEALTALKRAANVTRSYLADAALGEENLGGSNPLDGDARREISRYWTTVGEKLAECHGPKVDGLVAEALRDLSDRCFEKAEYWAVPSEWKNSEVDIHLRHIIEDVDAELDDLVDDPRKRD